MRRAFKSNFRRLVSIASLTFPRKRHFILGMRYDNHGRRRSLRGFFFLFWGIGGVNNLTTPSVARFVQGASPCEGECTNLRRRSR